MFIRNIDLKLRLFHLISFIQAHLFTFLKSYLKFKLREAADMSF